MITKKKSPALSRYVEIILCNTLQNEYIYKLLWKHRAKYVLPCKHVGSVGDSSDLYSQIPGSSPGGHADYPEIPRSFLQSLQTKCWDITSAKATTSSFHILSIHPSNILYSFDAVSYCLSYWNLDGWLTIKQVNKIPLQKFSAWKVLAYRHIILA